jgi:type IV secretory pathway TraG/TraD family ATPase VirD4
MFRFLELLILDFIRWFYTLPPTVGLVFLGGPGILFLSLQFIHRGKKIIPGLLGVLFVWAEYMHFKNPLSVMASLENAAASLESPLLSGSPLGILEPIFSIFVAPFYGRRWWEEVLFIELTLYLGMVTWVSLQEFKKTGTVIGDLTFDSLVGSNHSRPTRSTSNELGSGDLANTEQIANWVKANTKKYDTVLWASDLRGAEGVAFKTAKLTIPLDQRNRHILAVAKTGSGKTTKLILPILYGDCLCEERSTIVLDSKPEMWRKLAAMTKKHNPKKNIMLFNPLDVMRSLSWNILSKIEDETDCKLISNTIIMATDQPQSKSDSPFFRNNALSVLNAIMVGLLKDPTETLSMPRIHSLVQLGMKGLCSWLEAHPEAIRTTRTFVELARSGSQNADTIMSELSMRLSAWDLPAIRATTSQNELDLESLIQEPSLLIIELRESEIEMLRPMANVIVVEILRFLTKRAESSPKTTLPRPVSLVIDEFASSIGRLPDIHVKLNTLRSRNVSIVATIQSIAQIKANYGEQADPVLAGFSTKILMPMLDIQDAEWASKETGQMTIRFKTQSTGSNKKIIEFFASKNDNIQEQVQQRAVLTPDEIGRPVDNICTFFMPNTPVFQGHLIPYYKIAEPGKRISESETKLPELKLREHPIEYNDSVIAPVTQQGNEHGFGGAGGSADSVTGFGGAPSDTINPNLYGNAGFTDTTGWSDDQIRVKLEDIKKNKLDWENTTGSAKKWWEAFEEQNKTMMNLVLRLAEELAVRNATITDFFLAYIYSNTDNIPATLSYLDYTRLKKEDEDRKKGSEPKTDIPPGEDPFDKDFI